MVSSDNGEYVFAMTPSKVIRHSVDMCNTSTSCNECLTSGDPICGWCPLINSCTRRFNCPSVPPIPDPIWLRDVNNTCPVISIISPSVIHIPQLTQEPVQFTMTTINIASTPLSSYTYQCQFQFQNANSEIHILRTPATQSNDQFMCNSPSSSQVSQLFNGQDTLDTVISLVVAGSNVDVASLDMIFQFTDCSVHETCTSCIGVSRCQWCPYSFQCTQSGISCVADNSEPIISSGGVCPEIFPSSVTGEYYIHTDYSFNSSNLSQFRNDFDNQQFRCEICSQSDVSCDTPLFSSLALLAPSGNEVLCQQMRYDAVNGSPTFSAQLRVVWNNQGTIENRNDASVIFFNCAKLADGCSSCLGSGFDCTWCNRVEGMADSCVFTGTCDATPINAGENCPAPSIIEFNPTSGPVEGGTTITISGRELGVTFDDFSGNSITVGDTPCTPTDRQRYVPGRQINCITTSGNTMGSQVIHISLPSGSFMTQDLKFLVTTPRIKRVSPSLGPMAGGTKVTVFGTNLDIGNTEDTRITVDGGGTCEIDQASTVQANSINCTTSLSIGSPGTSGLVVVAIDNGVVTNSSVLFTYVPNPEFYSVSPSNTILAGGIELIFNGSNLDSVQNPVLVILDSLTDFQLNTSVCTVLNSTTISCVTPSLTRLMTTSRNRLTYTVMVDNATGPDPNSEGLQLTVSPNPGNFSLLDSEYNVGSNHLIRILGKNINSVRAQDYHVTIGDETCKITATTDTEINCAPPSEPPGGINQAIVVVTVGAYLRETLNQPLLYVAPTAIPLRIIIPVVAGSVVALVILSLFIICCIFLYHRKTLQRVEMEWIDMISPKESTNLSALPSTKQPSNGDKLLQLVPDELVITSNNLRLLNKPIGQGEFGVVYKGQLSCVRGNNLPQVVAIKTVKGLFTSSDLEKIISEVTKMKDFNHPNVMPLIGVCLDAGPGVSIVMPFMANGCLLDYLRKERDNLYLCDIQESDETMLSVRRLLLRMCYQVSSGMAYLASQKFVHRDLAARNCMLDNQGTVKVGDFGLAEDIYTMGYFRQDKSDAIKLPFKWMAPESLRDGLFSEKSDVWSFGITCWEVFSAGRIPYPAVDPTNILKFLEEGMRMEKPENVACTAEYYSLMKECWALDPEVRPTFDNLYTMLDKLLLSTAGYLELGMLLLPDENEVTVENSDGYVNATDALK